jgi:hyperosmotically inducible protein
MKNQSNFKSTVLVIALALGASSLQAYAFGTADDVDQSAYASDFKALDKDNDGTLDKAEVKHDKLFANKIKAADKDNDGTLDQAEYTEYRSQAEKKNMKRVVSDSTITSKVKAELLKDQGFKSLKVSVKTNHGVVLLSGFVDTEEQIKQAEKIARSVEGVTTVKNSLLVKKQ